MADTTYTPGIGTGHHGDSGVSLQITGTPTASVEAAPPKGFKIARGPDGRLFGAIVGAGGALTLQRYNDSQPPGVAATLTAESSGVTSCCLHVNGSGEVLLAYCKGGDAFFRKSRDQGASVTVAITVATGYDRLADFPADEDGMWVLMLLKNSVTSWYVTVGELGDDNVTWTFTTPALVTASAADADGDLIRHRDGTWEFGFITGAGAASILRCRKLLKTGVGTFS